MNKKINLRQEGESLIFLDWIHTEDWILCNYIWTTPQHTFVSYSLNLDDLRTDEIAQFAN